MLKRDQRRALHPAPGNSTREGEAAGIFQIRRPVPAELGRLHKVMELHAAARSERVALQPMAETIRDYFKRRTRRALTITVVGVAAAATGITLFGFGYLYVGGVGTVLGVIIVFSGLCYLELARCPRCLHRLSATASSARLPTRINFCPYCGANLDSDCPSRMA